MVNRAARAVGMVATPAASSASSMGVAMASISGTTRCGCSLLNQRLELGGPIVMVRE
jgi:purine nucleoside phosphorylase